MQTDVNKAKSKAFNIQLRMFQLSICLLATFLVDSIFRVTCTQASFKIIDYLGLTMVLVALGGMIFEVTRKQHNKTAFNILFGINVVCSLVIVIFSAINYHQSHLCPTKSMLYIYYLTNIPIYLILTAMIFLMPFFWVQRFTNSPGSAAWPFLFMLEAYHTRYTVLMMLIGFFALVTNVLTWTVNGLALMNGVSTTLKKIIWVCFIISLSFTIINEVMALFIVFAVPASDFKHVLVKSMV